MMTSHLSIQIARINHLNIPRDPPRRGPRIRPDSLRGHRSTRRDDAIMRVRGPAPNAAAIEQRRPLAVLVSVDISSGDGVGLDMVDIGWQGARAVDGFEARAAVGLDGPGAVGARDEASGRAVADDHACCRVEEGAVAVAVEGDPVGGEVGEVVGVDWASGA